MRVLKTQDRVGAALDASERGPIKRVTVKRSVKPANGTGKNDETQNVMQTEDETLLVKNLNLLNWFLIIFCRERDQKENRKR